MAATSNESKNLNPNESPDQIQEAINSIILCHQKALSELDNYTKMIRKSTAIVRQTISDITTSRNHQ